VLQQEKPVVALLSALHGLWVDSAYAQGGTEAIYFFINDHLGTPQKVVDEAGQLVWSADYRPFGQVDGTTSTHDNRFRLPGQYYDGETGLHYNYLRDYHPGIGRYIEPDPLHLAEIMIQTSKSNLSKLGSAILYQYGLSNPQLLNPYVYSLNNSINLIDPTGESVIDFLKCAYYTVKVGAFLGQCLSSEINYTTR